MFQNALRPVLRPVMYYRAAIYSARDNALTHGVFTDAVFRDVAHIPRQGYVTRSLLIKSNPCRMC